MTVITKISLVGYSGPYITSVRDARMPLIGDIFYNNSIICTYVTATTNYSLLTLKTLISNKIFGYVLDRVITCHDVVVIINAKFYSIESEK